jgi:neutral ceramidase
MLQVGFGVADVTPDVGMEMPGGFFKRKGTGVRDKLLASACVVHDGDAPVALVGLDALFVTRPIVDVARRLIVKDTKIPGENVLIGANHTHSGGPVASCLGCDENPDYTDKMAKAIAEAVKSAWTTLHAAEVGVGAGSTPGIAFNRRFLMRDGREITHPGKPGTEHFDDIVAPAGPTDPDVGVLAFRQPGAEKPKVAGVVVNFACHSTVVGGDQFSPDYAGYLRKHLKTRYGDDFPVVFLLGPCGDVTQVNNLSSNSEFGVDYADMMGMKLAAETVRVVEQLQWLKEAPTAAATETASVEIRPEPDADRERPPFGLGSDGKDGKVGEVYADERKRVAEERKKTPKLAAEVQGLRIGPLGIASTGAEYFCDFGLRIKKASRHPTTWVVSLANENLGYVPTPQAFVGGGYEPRTARSSKLAVDAGQRILEAALKALGKVAPAAK